MTQNTSELIESGRTAEQTIMAEIMELVGWSLRESRHYRLDLETMTLAELQTELYRVKAELNTFRTPERFTLAINEFGQCGVCDRQKMEVAQLPSLHHALGMVELCEAGRMDFGRFMRQPVAGWNVVAMATR